MNTRDSIAQKCEDLVDDNLQTQWERTNWKEAEKQVNWLQIRIAKATKEGNWNLVIPISNL